MYNAFITEFLAQHIIQMHENTLRIRRCLDTLDEKDVWQRPNQVSNTIGNLILHLNGNITQYVIAALGHKPDVRNREAEFMTTGGFNKSQLLKQLKRTVTDATAVLRKLKVDELITIRKVQGFSMSGTAILVQVLEHYSYHTGQIVFATKLIAGKHLGFYQGQDLNAKNG
jgi:uncharacterized damage-inducible protein DinB